MRLHPSDLGDQWHVLFVRRRTRQGAHLPLRSLLATDDAARRRVGPLGRLWLRGLPVSREAAVKTLPYAGRETRRPVIAGIVSAAALAMPALAGYASPDGAATAALLGGALSLTALWTGAVVVPHRRFRRLHARPISLVEVDDLLRQAAPPIRPAGSGSVFVALAGELKRALREQQHGTSGNPAAPPLGDLEIAFLTLVRDVLAAPGPQSAPAQRDLRNALRALGEAVAGLPHVCVSPAETLVLRQNASAIRARAKNENDAVVAASLARQAEALEREADAADQTNVIARRTAFLRQELLAQTRALRAGLFATAAQNTSTTAPAQNPSALSSVAQAVEAVAGEAKALARAHLELDEPDQFVPSLSPAPVAEVRLRQR